MIISLIRSWTAKVRNTLYDVLNWIRDKRSSSSDEGIIPQYQRKDWRYTNYGYIPIVNKQGGHHHHHHHHHHNHDYDYNNRVRWKQENQHTVHDNNNDSIQHTAVYSHVSSTSNVRYQKPGTPPLVTLIRCVEDKADTYKTPHPTPRLLPHIHPPSSSTIVATAATKASIVETIASSNIVSSPVKTKKEKGKKRGETGRQRRLRRKRQKEAGDLLITSKPISFHDEDTRYTLLRTKAHEALLKKIARRKESDDAFKKGNKRLGRDLLAKSRSHHDEMIKLNKQAADHKYNEKNKGRPSNVIDLHGLFVSEAREKLKAAIHKCKSEKKNDMIVIVGNGNHSHDKVSKLKPAMMEYLKSLQLQHIPNKPNSGCLLVQFK